MIARRILSRVAPVAARPFSMTSVVRSGAGKFDVSKIRQSRTLEEATDPEALFGPGPKPGEIPNDFEQATGIERLELLAKLEGIELFDTKPLEADRKGTPTDPIIVDSYDPVRYVGCTGFPAGSQEVNWIRLEIGKIGRDWESGCCYKLNYLGPPLDEHHH